MTSNSRGGGDAASAIEPRLDFQARPAVVQAIVDAELLAHGYMVNPTFATETSLIDPLPHQRVAVYEAMLPQAKLRFLLADDAGAGKTIMTGLYVREMLARGRLRRILIVPPAGLVGNWQRELAQLFRLPFRIVAGSDLRAGNPFGGADSHQVIVSLDTLTGDAMQKALWSPEVQPYELVVFDEAHKLAADQAPDGSITKTHRYRLAERLTGAEPHADGAGWTAEHLLLLTATPHMGKAYPYFALWHLLEPHALPTPEAMETYPESLREQHYIRRTKEEMVTFDGQRLYPTRESTTVSYPLSPLEQTLYARTTEYIQESYNRAAVLNSSAARLAMGVFQRRLASSAFALRESLSRRDAKLAEYIREAEAGRLNLSAVGREQGQFAGDPFDTKTGDDEASQDEGEGHEVEEDAVGALLLAASLPELRQERAEVADLIALAQHVLDAEDEAKFRRLRELLRDPQFRGEKLIVFTEHRDTLRFLMSRLEALGYTGRLAQIHGGMPYGDREAQVEAFRRPAHEGGADILLATDAAGEGINLQFCWVMVNYDIPWNPARLEQRMGRIHRYKQRHDPVLIFNLVADNTREGRVMKTLLDKLDLIRQELHSDKVFDVIGRQLADWSLRDLLFAALDDAALEAAVAARLTVERTQAVLAASDAVLPPAGDVVTRLPEERARWQREGYHRLLPGYVRHFLERAVPLLGLERTGDWDGTFGLAVRAPGAPSRLDALLERYRAGPLPRWTLSKPHDGDKAVYLHPGEPFFDALCRWAVDAYGEESRRGGVFVDPEAEDEYVLHVAEVQVVRQHGPGGQTKPVETRLVGLRQWRDGRMALAAVEQLLLLQPRDGIPTASLPWAARAESQREDAAEYLREHLTTTWLAPMQDTARRQAETDLAQVETGYQILEAHLATQRSQLTKSVRAGERGAEGRLAVTKQRQANLDRDKAEVIGRLREEPEGLRLGPVRWVTHALVVPTEDPVVQEQFTADVEQVAMAVAASALEREGFLVTDVSTPARAISAGLPEWPGFDVWARHPDGRERAVEVKGRASRGDVQVSDNEWATACTQRDRYWLYVVWHCGSPAPHLLQVPDPFGRLLAHTGGGVTIDAAALVRAAEGDG